MKSSLKFLLGVLLLCQYACGNTNGSPKATAAAPVEVENEGVNISYDDSKKGDTTLLLVHGWNIDKTYWTNQTAYFAKKYRVVAIDLPGFGKSGKNRNNWNVEEYGKDITALITRLNLNNVILVGHSMSGAIVVETALKNPARVIGVVGVDNFTNFGAVVSPELKKDIAEAYKALRSNYKNAVLQYATQSLFSPATDSAVKAKVINDFLNADSVMTTNILEQNDHYPTDEKLKALGKTIYLINSNHHATDTSGFKKYGVPYVLLSVGPTGHYPMLEAPNEFNKQLEQVIFDIRK